MATASTQRKNSNLKSVKGSAKSGGTSGASASGSDLGSHVAQLRSDLAQLKTDVGGLLSSLRAGGEVQAQQARENVEERVQEARKLVQAKLGEGGVQARKHFEERPLLSIAAVFGAGYLAGRLLRR